MAEKDHSAQFHPAGMSRDETIILFLRGMRIVLNNASAYPTDHPYFMKSVEDFREKTQLLLGLLNPIALHATPDTIFMDGRSWGKDALYVDLAHVFHLRKIKTIEIRQGVSASELCSFLSVIGLPRRDFIRRGGCKRLIPQGAAPHIEVEELDYSMFLGQGTEEVDVWVFLLREAIDKEDREKIMKLADSFGNIVGTFKVSDLADDEELRENIRRFIRYLRDHYRDKLKECSRQLFSTVDRFKRVIKTDEVERIKAFFREVDEENLAAVLWEEVVVNEEFDAISLNLFIHLVDQQRHGAISSIFADRMVDRELLKNNPGIARRMNELISSHVDESTSAVYQNIISQLMTGIEYKDDLSYDRENLAHNYRYVLLTLLALENDPGRIEKIAARLIKDWGMLTASRDYGYVSQLAQLVSARKKKEALLVEPLKRVETKVSEFVESIIWEETLSPDVIGLLNVLESTARTSVYYLDKIFNEGRINKYAIMLYLRFFAAEIDGFSQRLKEHSRQVDFMARMVGSLSEVDDPHAADMLRYIYSCSNEFIKVEVLKGMKELSASDESFLLAILQKSDAYLKRAAFGVLVRKPALCAKALNILLNVSTLWGAGAKLLVENMAVVSEHKSDEVRQQMERLSRRRFFWNAPVRQLAQDILRRWNVRSH